MQLTVSPFLFAFAFNSVQASIDIDKQSGFDCGRVFFEKNVIRNAGSLVSRNLKRSSQISLVDEDSFQRRYPNHVGWPIRESGQIYGLSRSREIFYILVDSSGKVKDVMARLSNDDFTRCSRKNSRRKTLSLDSSNGYRCGQNFFGDEQLRGDVDEAISKHDQGLKYPIPYKGNLYPEHQYLSWPILNEKRDNTSHREQSPFHVIFSRDGKIIDVVAKLKCNDFIKCERATKSLRHRFTQSPHLLKRFDPKNTAWDYICDAQHTFEHGYLLLSLKTALVQADKNALYPMIHNKFPCAGNPCKLWPIHAKGRFYQEKYPAEGYFLTISSKSLLQEVVKQGPNGMEHCQKIPARNQASTSRPNAGGPVGGINGLPPGLVRNARGELVARPGSRPPTFIPRVGSPQQ